MVGKAFQGGVSRETFSTPNSILQPWMPHTLSLCAWVRCPKALLRDDWTRPGGKNSSTTPITILRCTSRYLQNPPYFYLLVLILHLLRFCTNTSHSHFNLVLIQTAPKKGCSEQNGRNEVAVKKYFLIIFMQTDGDVVEDPAITRTEADVFIAAGDLKPTDRILDLCCGQGRHTLEVFSFLCSLW